MPDYCEDQLKSAMAEHQCGAEQAAAILEEQYENEEESGMTMRAPGGVLEFKKPAGESYMIASSNTHDYLITIDQGYTILSQYRYGKFEAVQRWRRKGSWNADAMRIAERWEAEK